MAGRQSGFNQHDDRSGGPVRYNRGGGGRGRGGRSGRGNRGRGVNPRSRFDDDYDMAGGQESSSRGQRNRYQPYSHSKHDNKGSPQSDESGGSVFSRLGNQKSSGRAVFGRLSGGGEGSQGGADGSWHKVTVLKGADESREWLLKQLSSKVSESFEAVGVHTLGDKFMFFVAEAGAAGELRQLGSIESRNGTLSVFVKASAPPRTSRGPANNSRDTSEQRPTFSKSYNSKGRMGGDSDIAMQEDVAQVIQQVLGLRYDSNTKSLDLSNMYHDPAFKQAGTRVSMFDRNIVSMILSLIGTYCPDLLSLDLSNNRLNRLELYADLSTKCSELQMLNLSENQIRSPSELEHIAGLKKLTTLALGGNPISQQSNDFVSYAANFRKYFPALQVLDGQQLPTPVKFDLPVSLGKLPAVQKSYFLNDEVKGLVASFLEQFYKMYDYESREKLLEAYSSDAVFSLCVCSNGPKSHGIKDYESFSRNLLNQGKRKTSHKKGHLDIVQFLRDLPRTVHHAKTFVVDNISVTPMYTAFVVNGLFSEVEGRLSGSNPVFAFTRMFVLSHVGNGVTVSNDQFTIRGATEQGLQSIQEGQSQLPVQPGINGQSVVPNLSGPQIQAVQTLSARTQMNAEFSQKCLEENGWDFNKAVTVFTVLQSEGKIPQGAFM